MEDRLIITIDNSKFDKPILLVARTLNNSSLKIVNQFFDEDVIEIYNKLICDNYYDELFENLTREDIGL